jgi:hypothetical protein
MRTFAVWLRLSGFFAGLALLAGCTDGTTPDCSDAQCLPVLVDAGWSDAPDAPAAADDASEPDAADGG